MRPWSVHYRFLGCLITSEGLKTVPDKIDVIMNFPKPETIAQLRCFLAMINFYRRVLPKRALTQAPLYEFQKDSKENDIRPVPWNEDAALAF